jgi:2-polyprenyl-6-methoxyphenol hydroxylase-like FAD-dependent oxidoreductase
MSIESHVLIAGAGPAGLTLAIELARRGVPHRIVDRRMGPFNGSRGKGLQPRTLEVFEDIGVLDRIFAAGGPYPPTWIHDADGGHEGGPITAGSPTSSEPYAFPWMIMQSQTEAILRERLGELGGAVEWGVEIIEASQDDVVRTRLRTPLGETVIESTYLVGADGGRSTVRGLLDIGFPGRSLGVRAIVADLCMSGLDETYWHRFNEGEPGRQLLLCPLRGTDLIQLQAPVPLEGEIETDVSALQAMVLERTGRDDLRIAGVPWVSVYQMSARLADRYCAGRIFLVGDAAHIHPPTGGQGLNTSIQDAYNLGWKLAAVVAGAPSALLESYEDERRPIAEGMLGLSTRLLAAASRGGMRRGRETQQLDIGYEESPLALEAPFRSEGVRAGQRAPDARLATDHGSVTRLFELMLGAHWTLLAYESPHDAIGAATDVHVHHVGSLHALRDEGGSFAATYGAQAGDWFLIRPDGYIGAILGSDEHHLLHDYLETVGGVT